MEIFEFFVNCRAVPPPVRFDSARKFQFVGLRIGLTAGSFQQGPGLGGVFQDFLLQRRKGVEFPLGAQEGVKF